MNQALSLSFFKNKFDKLPKVLEVLPGVLTKHTIRVDKDGLLYSPTHWQDGATRGDKGINHLAAVTLDYDGEGADLDATLERLKGIECIYHTTHNNQPGKPKFRVILPLAKPATLDNWLLVHHGAAVLAGQTGLDPTCAEPSRMYYAPSCPPEFEDAKRAAYLEGRRLTVAELVETAAIHHPEVPPARHQAAGRPGDDYNTRFSWNDVLAPHGWQLVTERQGVGYWQKPGASGKEHHATTNYKGSDCLYVFSPLTSLPHKQGLTKFAAYTYLNHDGDFSAATKLLAAEGYVSSPPTVSQSHNAIEWPEPVSLPYGLHPVETFDFDLLPSTLRPWAQDICERVQCPPDFVAVGIMVGLGSLIGRKVGIRPQGLTDWVVTANQWGLVVGRPGVMKSPALEQALTPLKRLAAKANEQYTIALAQYELQAKAAELRAAAAKRKAADILRDNPQADLLSVLSVPSLDVPTLNRYISTDSTPEALGELLRHNPNGVLVHRDELVSLLKGLDREGREEGRGFYLTGWNGDSSYTFDRIGRGMNLHIPAVCISLLGGTQPGRLAEYIHHAVKGGSGDDGLLQRFGLLVWPDTEGEWKDVDRWPDNDAKLAAYNVFDYLDAIDTETVGAQQDTDGNGQPEGIPYLRFDPGALSLFHEWRSGLESRLRSGELHPALESHLAKYRKLIPGLALIIHLSDRETGSVTERATRQALAWSRYLETHARRAYGSATQPEIDAAKAILKHIRRGDLHDGFSARDAYRNGWAHLADREQVFSGLQLLVDYDWLRDERRTDTGGRHATVYIVNPRGLP